MAAGHHTISAQVLVSSIMNAINLVIHRHITHSTVSVHFIHLTTFSVVLDHTIVFLSELGPLHVGVVQAAVMVLPPAIVVRIVAANVARARASMLPGAVDVPTRAVDSELDLPLVPRLTHASFRSNCWKSHLVLHLVEEEERHGPLASVLVPN